MCEGSLWARWAEGAGKQRPCVGCVCFVSSVGTKLHQHPGVTWLEHTPVQAAVAALWLPLCETAKISSGKWCWRMAVGAGCAVFAVQKLCIHRRALGASPAAYRPCGTKQSVPVLCGVLIMQANCACVAVLGTAVLAGLCGAAK